MLLGLLVEAGRSPSGTPPDLLTRTGDSGDKDLLAFLFLAIHTVWMVAGILCSMLGYREKTMEGRVGADEELTIGA